MSKASSVAKSAGKGDARRARSKRDLGLTTIQGGGSPAFKLFPPEILPNSHHSTKFGSPWILSNADAVEAVSRLPAKSVDCLMTSPPYYWQRDYGVDGQLGQEDTVEAFVAALTAVLDAAKNALKPTGTAFVVIGDTYYSGRGQPKGSDPKQAWRGVSRQKYRAVDRPGFGLPQKSLIGVPWRLGLSLQKSGWILRSAVVWRKPKALAEPSVLDRPWTTTETIFILSKSKKYYFNREALNGEEDIWEIPARIPGPKYRHAAPFPEALVERCLAVGCPPGGVVLDPFAGSGTTLLVAAKRGLTSIGVELNPAYVVLARERLAAARR
jgi:DNA modification methylase